MKIGVIGLGLIGGSILQALSAHHEMYAVSTSSALDASLYGKTSSEYEILSECEVVFVCRPMDKINETLLALNDIVSEDTIVTEISSVKSFVTKEGLKYKLISTHPMAGSEKTGFSASDINLFKGAKWVIECENSTLEELIKEMGATPVLCSNEEQDKACAMISHFPLLASIVLFDIARDNKYAKLLAASGFRDMTRLASGSAQMSVDFIKYNTENINQVCELFIEKLNNLKNLSGDEKMKLFEEIQKQRLEMYDNEGKNTTTL